MADLISNSKDYLDLLARLKSQIRTAQVRAAVAVNHELVLLYWGIGKAILERQDNEGWGSKVIERLAKDLRSEFPDMQGLSPRNLKYMRALAEAWPEESIVQQAVAQIPWGQIESGLYGRQGKALTNFQATLPPPQSDLAQQLIKDPYNFDF
jgi:predicted nuclease of restriction endonuclease-like (RecB) superfamily